MWICRKFLLHSDMVLFYVNEHEKLPKDVAYALQKAGAKELMIFLKDNELVIIYNCDDYDTFLSELKKSTVNADWERFIQPCFIQDSLEDSNEIFSMVFNLTSFLK